MDKQLDNKILTSDYLALFKEVVAHIVLHDLTPKAFKLMEVVEEAVDENMEVLKQQPMLLKTYQTEIFKLKFVCLPMLSRKEIVAMIKRHFMAQFDVENYDLIKKIEHKLLFLNMVEDRNALKQDIIEALFENKEKMSNNHELRTVQDWLKNYIAKVGLNKIDNLVKAQYLTSLRNNEKLDPKERARIIGLLNFYGSLTVGSDTPQGFEEEVPIFIGDKLQVFRKGVLEPVPNLGDKYKQATEILKRMEEEKKGGTKGGQEEEEVSKEDVFDVQNHKENNVDLLQLEALKEALKSYSPTSLEYKVIKQEIDKLNKSK